MRRLTAVLLLIVLVFSLCACENTPKENYEELVEYIKENGEQIGTTYFIKTNLIEISDIWEDRPDDYTMISIDSSNVLHLEERLTSVSGVTTTHIEYTFGDEFCKLTVLYGESDVQVRTARFSTKYAPSGSLLLDYEPADELFAEGYKSNLAGYANMLLSRTDWILNIKDVGIVLKDIGMPTGNMPTGSIE